MTKTERLGARVESSLRRAFMEIVSQSAGDASDHLRLAIKQYIETTLEQLERQAAAGDAAAAARLQRLQTIYRSRDNT